MVVVGGYNDGVGVGGFVGEGVGVFGSKKCSYIHFAICFGGIHFRLGWLVECCLY